MGREEMRRGRALSGVGGELSEDTAIGPSERSRIREEDLALARRAAAGDRAALHVVVDRHAKDLFRLARGLCPTVADAEEVVQETLIAVFRKIGTFDGRAALLTWMSRILIRRARKLGRQRSRRTTVSLDETLDLRRRGANLEATTTGQDSRLDLAEALPHLSPEYREVIVLRELKGMSYADIAATLGIPQGTVESRIFRARSELRERLRAYRP
jgi:RNA polymerase sigma-70 factor (ECF subfamily)